MMAESGKLTEEEQYLSGIWNSLGVGQNGFISIEELGKVCSHIGMEEMNQTVGAFCIVHAMTIILSFKAGQLN